MFVNSHGSSGAVERDLEVEGDHVEGFKRASINFVYRVPVLSLD